MVTGHTELLGPALGGEGVASEVRGEPSGRQAAREVGRDTAQGWVIFGLVLSRRV